MINTIRFGGAQIPVTPFIKKNVLALKKAIDWGSENNVDYLVTPEAALSGYAINFDNDIGELVAGLTEIEKYAASKQVGLCLGTLWLEQDNTRRNQIRYYTSQGKFISATNKMVLTPWDNQLGITQGEILKGIVIPFHDEIIPAAGLICADLYGHASNEGGLPEKFFNIGAKIYIHATNAERNVDATRDKIEEIWLEANLQRISYYMLPVISVDNCYTMQGEKYRGKTATQSGVCFKGQWVTKVPRSGTHYFYHDFDIDDLKLIGPSE